MPKAEPKADSKPSSPLVRQFKRARGRGTPLIAIKTFDPEATMQAIQAGSAPETPIMFWEAVDGLHDRNVSGAKAIQEALNGAPVEKTRNLVNALSYALKTPFVGLEECQGRAINPIIFVLNAHRYLNTPDIAQAIWNCRDPFKKTLRSIVLLAPDFQFPSELQQDILELDEPLPDEKELATVVDVVARQGGIQVNEETRVKAVDALRGLSKFPAEQSAALAVTTSGMDLEELWQRKKKMIRQTAGLSVWTGGNKFDDLGGLKEVKLRLRRIIAGKARPRVVVWIDEIEKFMAGSNPQGGDSSGTSSDQLGVILSEMADMEYTGLMGVGVPGSGKSDLAKAFANEIGVLTIKLDFGALKNSLVGSSEERIRTAMKIISAVAGGKGGAFFIATSNDIRVVKPELKRRFDKGIWFFDLPSAEEREVIWKIYLTKYGIKEDHSKVRDTDWTGAEIRVCCKTADEESISLIEAARSIIPVAISGKEDIERLRNEASNRYNSTTQPGRYEYYGPEANNQSGGERSMAFNEEDEVTQ